MWEQTSNAESSLNYGIPIMTSDLFEKLQILDPGTPLLRVQLYSFNGVRIQVFNEKFITKDDKAKGDEILSSMRKKGTVSKKPNTGVVYLPSSWENLKSCFEALSDRSAGQVLLLDIKRNNLAHILSFFTYYEDFANTYEEYMKDPDPIIRRRERKLPVTGIRTLGDVCPADVRATVHLLLLLMCKTFKITSFDRNNYIDKYLERRLRPLRSRPQNAKVKFLLNPRTVHQMSNIWNAFPKLKTKFFYQCMELCEEFEIRLAVNLLRSNGMVVLNTIEKFLSHRKSRAHNLPIIVTETNRYLEESKPIKEELADAWPYYKLLRPEDKTLESSKFPNLVKASFAYARAHLDGEEFIPNIKLPNHPTEDGVEEAAKILIHDEDELLNIPRSTLLAARDWGIDLTKEWFNFRI